MSEILSWIEAAGISAVIVILLLISIKCFTYGNNSVALIARGYVFAVLWGSLAWLLFIKSWEAAKNGEKA